MIFLTGFPASGLALAQRGSALELNFSVMGEKQVRAAIHGLIANVRDVRPAWTGFTDRRGVRVPGVEKRLRESIRERFRKEGAPQYPWPALSEFTALDRIRHGFPPYHPILQRTGELMDSLILKSHPMHIFNMAAKWMEFGTRDFKAVFHQSPAPRKLIPRRPMLYIDKLDFTKILSDIRLHLRNIGIGR